jgi:hypothetical protein
VLSDHGQKRVGQPLRQRNAGINLAKLIHIRLAMSKTGRWHILRDKWQAEK